MLRRGYNRYHSKKIDEWNQTIGKVVFSILEVANKLKIKTLQFIKNKKESLDFYRYLKKTTLY